MRASRKLIGLEDLKRCVSKGILSNGQLEQVLAAVGQAEPDGPEVHKGFNLPTICYYLGALVIAFAYTYLVYRHWDALTYGHLLGISLGTAAVLGGLGYLLRHRWQFTIAGGLLFFAAVALTPLTVYCIEQLTGLWPATGAGRYIEYFRVIHGNWVIMELATIAVSGLVLWWVRFPFLTAVPAHALWFLAMDIGALLVGPSGNWQAEWELKKQITVGVGLAMIAFGYLLERLTEKDYSFWLYLFGLLGFSGGLSLMSTQSELVAFLGYFLPHLAMIPLSVYLYRKTFLVFGVLGIYAYLGHLAFQVFPDAWAFPIVLGLCGLSLIVGTVLVQKRLPRLWGADDKACRA
ncbi:MAG: DUF2157 domain-containing protein [Candidatus Methylomirabilales bacterium]